MNLFIVILQYIDKLMGLIGYRERIGKMNGVWTDNIIMERRSKTVGI
ncbi:MAG TPA: hypothetical protein VKI61_00700 [Chitinophagaceae bacterium]|nr:hypothetical protein [Chitinophagaceae bacterium]